MNAPRIATTDDAFEKVELAGVYVDDGALASAARCLREAADILDEINADFNASMEAQS